MSAHMILKCDVQGCDGRHEAIQSNAETGLTYQRMIARRSGWRVGQGRRSSIDICPKHPTHNPLDLT